MVAKTSLAGLMVALVVAAAVGIASAVVRPNRYRTAASAAQAARRPSAIFLAADQTAARAALVAARSPSVPATGASVTRSNDAGSSAQSEPVAVVRRLNAARANAVEQSARSQVQLVLPLNSQLQSGAPTAVPPTAVNATAVNRPPAVASEW